MLVRLSMFSCFALVTSFLVAAGPDSVTKTKNTLSPAADSLLSQEAQGKAVNRIGMSSTDSDNDYCRWLSGAVKLNRQWRTVDDLDGDSRSALIENYEAMRGQSELTVDRHRELARWCSKNEMKPQAKAHWTAVTDYHADDIEARRNLGHTWISGVWVSREQLAQADDQLKKLAQDLREWSGPSHKIVKALRSDSAAAQQRALTSLKAMDDPSALAALEMACYEVDESIAGPIIETIAKFQSPAACMALTRIALANPESTRGGLAIAKVKEFPIEFYVPELLGLLSTPIETRVQYGVNYLGELQLQRLMFRTTSNERQLIEYNRLVRVNEPIAHEIRVSEFVSVVRRSRDASGSVQRTPNVSSQINIAIDETAAAKNAIQDQEDLDRKIAQYNRDQKLKSKNVYAVLGRTTGMQLDNEPKEWWEWWRKYNYRSESAKPLARKTYNQVDQSPLTLTKATYIGAIQQSCLVAGTQVQTATGLQAVESLKVGDMVLSQDVESGEMALKPVVRTTLRSPETIYNIKTEAGEIRATGGHRWWIAGQGWVMSVKLNPEMLMHNAKGTTKILSVEEEAEPLPTHNLVVDDFHTYFVGPDRVLSFDNVDPIPSMRKVPGY